MQMCTAAPVFVSLSQCRNDHVTCCMCLLAGNINIAAVSIVLKTGFYNGMFLCSAKQVSLL